MRILKSSASGSTLECRWRKAQAGGRRYKRYRQATNGILCVPRRGEFLTLAEAILECQTIVNEFLVSALTPGMSAAELIDQYYLLGDDAFIRGADERYSAGDYAKKRCVELCTAGAALK